MRQTEASPPTRGILRPAAGFEHFRLERAEPPPELAANVVWFWTVQWELPEGTRFNQEILPFPCVNLACESGTWNVHGPGTERFVAELHGAGWVSGVRFTPAGFAELSRRPMRELVDRVWPAHEVLAEPLPAAPDEPLAARQALTAYLVQNTPCATPTQREVDRLVALTQCEASTVRVESLASAAGQSKRSLQRLFERYVGVGSKWIVRRARVHEAAERVARGERIDWAALAAELGYHDQAHLIRDFRAQLGETPAVYARRAAPTR